VGDDQKSQLGKRRTQKSLKKCKTANRKKRVPGRQIERPTNAVTFRNGAHKKFKRKGGGGGKRWKEKPPISTNGV